MVQKPEARFIAIAPANRNVRLTRTERVLCLDLSPDEREAVLEAAAGSDVALIEGNYAEFDETFLDKVRPHVVVVPIFSKQFDVLDAAETLGLSGYFGALWAVGPHLPNPTVIEREIREVAGEIDVRLLTCERRYLSVTRS